MLSRLKKCKSESAAFTRTKVSNTDPPVQYNRAHSLLSSQLCQIYHIFQKSGESIFCGRGLTAGLLNSCCGTQVQMFTGSADPSPEQQQNLPSPPYMGRLNRTAKPNCAFCRHSTYSSFCQCVKKKKIKVKTTRMGKSALSPHHSAIHSPQNHYHQQDKCSHQYVCACVGHPPRVKAIYSSTVAKLHSSCQLASLPVEVDRPAASSSHLGQLKGHACHISHDHTDIVNHIFNEAPVTNSASLQWDRLSGSRDPNAVNHKQACTLACTNVAPLMHRLSLWP